MTFEEFRKMTYHTRTRLRIPGSRTIIDKATLTTKGKYDFKKEEIALREVYESERFINK